MRQDRRIQELEEKVAHHLKSDCTWCREAVFRVDAPACALLVQWNREIRERLRAARRRG